MKQIDAWGSVKIDNYDHVFKDFGLSKFEDTSFVDHYLFDRKLIVAHRDFPRVAQAIKESKKFIQLTGIAASGDLHFGHKVDVDFFNIFKGLGALSKFAVCDIDAYVSRPDSKVPTIDAAKEVAVRNVADLIALGVDPKDIYVQSQKEREYYQFTFEVSKKITQNAFEGVYGHVDLGKVSAVLLQIADILHVQLPFMYGPAPTLTGIGIDQDPHARITRDLAKRFPYKFVQPSFFYFVHQSGLKEGSKMSASEPDTAIFLADTPAKAKKKINRAFTGGRETVEEQREKGGDPTICKVYEMFKFHHPDNEFVEKTFADCKSGSILCGECKQNCIKFTGEFLEAHQEKHNAALPKAKEIVFGK